MRIVSLLPSATEIVCALGLTDSLVGISHDCDYPPEVRARPVLSEAIVTSDLPSGAIDARIRDHLHRGRSVYHLDEAQLARLRPELILTQELCQVCAPSYTLVKQAAKVLDAATRIMSLEPRGLRDILDNVLLVGDLTGTSRQARTIVDHLQERIDAVQRAVAGASPLRVICIEWLEPIFVGGHWVPEMVEIAGGRDVLGRAGEPSCVVDWEQVVEAQPDVVVLMPCGFDLPRARRQVNLLTARPGWDDLPAVRTGRVYLTDASAYFNRPGPRIVVGLEILATILQPGRFSGPIPAHSVEQLSPGSPAFSQALNAK